MSKKNNNKGNCDGCGCNPCDECCPSNVPVPISSDSSYCPDLCELAEDESPDCGVTPGMKGKTVKNNGQCDSCNIPDPDYSESSYCPNLCELAADEDPCCLISAGNKRKAVKSPIVKAKEEKVKGTNKMIVLDLVKNTNNAHPWSSENKSEYCLSSVGRFGHTLHLHVGNTYKFKNGKVPQGIRHTVYFSTLPVIRQNGATSNNDFPSVVQNSEGIIKVTSRTPKTFYYHSTIDPYAGGLIIIHNNK